ncbi:MAG: Transcriptional regulatory protein LiaR [Chloroflexi bacterium ADurb.Bin180]|nr:MAG: Transcriptional regulatory protein LiaR [Chloroflexi bacterium ADurb.Bin180]
MSAPLRILLVDDHVLFRQGIRFGIASRTDMEVVGQAGDGLEAITLARETMPDVILMDISMPRLGGLEATRQIKREMPHARILILTASEEDQDLLEAVKAGASGYLLKDLTAAELFERIQIVARGEVILSGLVANRILQELGGRARPDSERELAEPLSSRELEVLQRLAKGLTNREIADELFISEGTVKNHLKNILEKLHLSNRIQAAVYAVRQGLVDCV